MNADGRRSSYKLTAKTPRKPGTGNTTAKCAKAAKNPNKQSWARKPITVRQFREAHLAGRP